ncbi:MAG: class I SAM-dependent methyltransferase [Anaerolineae bacterium]|nr:class I SAM-dependent methyltransferase [Anaerolineae bacterium]
MSYRRLTHFLAGLTAGLLLAAAASIYRRRPLTRIPCMEDLDDDPAVAEAFGRIAEMPQMRLVRRLAARRALSLCNAGQAADLGCGAGQLAVELAQAAPELRVTGIDLSNLLLAQALRKAAAAGLAHRVDFRTGDVERAPFEDASLDLVVSTLSLHHWSNPAAVLDEVARILKPGGAFVIFDLRRDMAPPLYVLLWLVTRYVVPPALRRVQEPLGSRNAAYTPDEAAALAQASRLTGWRVARGPFWLSIEGRKI